MPPDPAPQGPPPIDPLAGERRWLKLWQFMADMPGKGQDLAAVLNGAVGDKLAAAEHRLAIPMELWHQGNRLDLNAAMGPQVRGAGGRITIWVHGLMASHRFWQMVSKDTSFPERWAQDLGATCICARYNTGQHISVNGQQLAAALEQLVAHWPVPVTEIELVGHSMGGLVARSAAHYGDAQDHDWVDMLRRMFLLASPSRGAPLEQVANVAAFTLRTIPNPWTWAIGWAIQQRSAGIKDLRHGWLVHQEWQERSSDGLTMGRRHLVPLLPHVDHFVAAGNLMEDEHHPLAKVVGDSMVAPFSAKDEGIDGSATDRAPVAARVFPGVSHGGIAGQDQVYEQLVEWAQR